ncbi:CYTH domain-containing protein [Candidatus Gracilibacteria bacterium]|nr:CYTH domain-containing protein [Candidatus Gracilibacteria bacterium]NUJ98981.1 CYTH domain-containing protein [Candidatus Gracilibacteria bacterium]
MEKEIKILEVNKDEIIEKLEKLGAIKTFEGIVHDIYYDYPDQKMDIEGRTFRVRKKGEEHLYTIKKKEKSANMKVAHEHEMCITDVESFTRVLEKYGLQRSREKKKYRISYSLGEVHFDLDIYDEIPPLLEIEAGSYLKIKLFIEKLDLGKHIHKTFGSRGLFKYYGKEY